MAAPANPRVSAEQYLEMERQSPLKSEFFNGVILAMSGGSLNHARIAANAISALSPALKPKGCSVFGSDLRIGVGALGYFYPDVSIVCGEPELATPKQDVLANPTVVVEVLSPSTEAFDRGDKFHAYRQIESLRHYVLVSQNSRTVDVISRHNGVWVIETVTGDESLRLDSLEVTVPLADLYDQVQFEEPSDAAV